jgi:hypothetical protein
LEGVTAAITAITGGVDSDTLHRQNNNLGPQPQILSFEHSV